MSLPRFCFAMALAVCAGLSGCSNMPTDAEMAKDFEGSKDGLTALVKEIGLNPKFKIAEDRLKPLGVRDAHFVRSNEVSKTYRAILFEVVSSGQFIDGYSKGYAYVFNPVTTTSLELDKSVVKEMGLHGGGRQFKKLGGHWFIYLETH